MQKEETDRLRSQTTGLIGAMDCFSEGIMLVNTDSEMWNILFVNDAWSRVTGECFIYQFCAGCTLATIADVYVHNSSNLLLGRMIACMLAISNTDILILLPC